MPVITRTASQSLRRELYIASAVLPLESPNQFAALFDELCQELKPVGRLEEDQVAMIAKLLWRKHRLKIFRDAGQARAEFHRKERGKSVQLSAAPEDVKARALILAQFIQEEEDKLSASPDETRARELEESEEKEQAALRDVTVERYIEDLELMERLDASVERASGRLQKYQTKRMTGSLSRPAADHRAPRWGRVRQ